MWRVTYMPRESAGLARVFADQGLDMIGMQIMRACVGSVSMFDGLRSLS
jgi:hypothetical protein